jgi:predicted translin family RNA/ssDNA-binding protein
VLKIKKTITDGDKEDMERFEMLKGQYISGNNSPSVIRELRRFVVRFLSEGKLKRNQALDLLLELSV